jgi:putative ABC transport system permease protein
VIINEAMARRYWPNLDPLNDRIIIAPNVGPEFDEPARQIVRHCRRYTGDALDQNPRPTMYAPRAQVADARSPRVRPIEALRCD